MLGTMNPTLWVQHNLDHRLRTRALTKYSWDMNCLSSITAILQMCLYCRRSVCSVPLNWFFGSDLAIDKDKATFDAHLGTKFFANLGKLIGDEKLVAVPLDIKTIRPIAGHRSRIWMNWENLQEICSENQILSFHFWTASLQTDELASNYQQTGILTWILDIETPLLYEFRCWNQ